MWWCGEEEDCKWRRVADEQDGLREIEAVERTGRSRSSSPSSAAHLSPSNQSTATTPQSTQFNMEDDELAAIRRARMQQLQQQGGQSGSRSGSGAGPSSNFLSQLGGRAGGAGGRRRGGDDDDDDDDGGDGQGQEQQRMAQVEEQKRQMLSTILDSDARERRE